MLHRKDYQRTKVRYAGSVDVVDSTSKVVEDSPASNFDLYPVILTTGMKANRTIIRKPMSDPTDRPKSKTIRKYKISFSYACTTEQDASNISPKIIDLQRLDKITTRSDHKFVSTKLKPVMACIVQRLIQEYRRSKDQTKVNLLSSPFKRIENHESEAHRTALQSQINSHSSDENRWHPEVVESFDDNQTVYTNYSMTRNWQHQRCDRRSHSHEVFSKPSSQRSSTFVKDMYLFKRTKAIGNLNFDVRSLLRKANVVISLDPLVQKSVNSVEVSSSINTYFYDNLFANVDFANCVSYRRNIHLTEYCIVKEPVFNKINTRCCRDIVWLKSEVDLSTNYNQSSLHCSNYSNDNEDTEHNEKPNNPKNFSSNEKKDAEETTENSKKIQQISKKKTIEITEVESSVIKPRINENKIFRETTIIPKEDNDNDKSTRATPLSIQDEESSLDETKSRRKLPTETRYDNDIKGRLSILQSRQTTSMFENSVFEKLKLTQLDPAVNCCKIIKQIKRGSVRTFSSDDDETRHERFSVIETCEICHGDPVICFGYEGRKSIIECYVELLEEAQDIVVKRLSDTTIDMDNLKILLYKFMEDNNVYPSQQVKDDILKRRGLAVTTEDLVDDEVDRFLYKINDDVIDRIFVVLTECLIEGHLNKSHTMSNDAALRTERIQSILADETIIESKRDENLLSPLRQSMINLEINSVKRVSSKVNDGITLRSSLHKDKSHDTSRRTSTLSIFFATQIQDRILFHDGDLLPIDVTNEEKVYESNGTIANDKKQSLATTTVITPRRSLTSINITEELRSRERRRDISEVITISNVSTESAQPPAKRAAKGSLANSVQLNQSIEVDPFPNNDIFVEIDDNTQNKPLTTSHKQDSNGILTPISRSESNSVVDISTYRELIDDEESKTESSTESPRSQDTSEDVSSKYATEITNFIDIFNRISLENERKLIESLTRHCEKHQDVAVDQIPKPISKISHITSSYVVDSKDQEIGVKMDVGKENKRLTQSTNTNEQTNVEPSIQRNSVKVQTQKDLTTVSNKKAVLQQDGSNDNSRSIEEKQLARSGSVMVQTDIVRNKKQPSTQQKSTEMDTQVEPTTGRQKSYVKTQTDDVKQLGADKSAQTYFAENKSSLDDNQKVLSKSINVTDQKVVDKNIALDNLLEKLRRVLSKGEEYVKMFSAISHNLPDVNSDQQNTVPIPKDVYLSLKSLCPKEDSTGVTNKSRYDDLNKQLERICQSLNAIKIAEPIRHSNRYEEGHVSHVESSDNLSEERKKETSNVNFVDSEMDHNDLFDRVVRCVISKLIENQNRLFTNHGTNTPIMEYSQELPHQQYVNRYGNDTDIGVTGALPRSPNIDAFISECLPRPPAESIDKVRSDHHKLSKLNIYDEIACRMKKLLQEIKCSQQAVASDYGYDRTPFATTRFKDRFLTPPRALKAPRSYSTSDINCNRKLPNGTVTRHTVASIQNIKPSTTQSRKIKGGFRNIRKDLRDKASRMMINSKTRRKMLCSNVDERNISNCDGKDKVVNKTVQKRKMIR